MKRFKLLLMCLTMATSFAMVGCGSDSDAVGPIENENPNNGGGNGNGNGNSGTGNPEIGENDIVHDLYTSSSISLNSVLKNNSFVNQEHTDERYTFARSVGGYDHAHRSDNKNLSEMFYINDIGQENPTTLNNIRNSLLAIVDTGALLGQRTVNIKYACNFFGASCDYDIDRLYAVEHNGKVYEFSTEVPMAMNPIHRGDLVYTQVGTTTRYVNGEWITVKIFVQDIVRDQVVFYENL